MNEQQNNLLFSFEASHGREPGHGAAPAKTATDTDDGRLRMAVEASGLTTYHWVIESDDILWSNNALDILGSDPRGYGSGRAFASFLDPDNFTSRYDTVMRSAAADDGAGVPFQIEYKFRPEGRMGRSSVWNVSSGAGGWPT